MKESARQPKGGFIKGERCRYILHVEDDVPEGRIRSVHGSYFRFGNRSTFCSVLSALIGVSREVQEINPARFIPARDSAVNRCNSANNCASGVLKLKHDFPCI